jgi:phage gpG-like protein
MDITARMNKAKRVWAREAGEHLVRTVRQDYLDGQVLFRRTENLANSIFTRITPQGDGAEVGTNVEYGIYWEQGIKEVTIRPRFKKCLAWPIAGKANKNRSLKNRLYTCAMQVTIPARPARPFLKPALVREQGELQRMANEQFQTALGEMFFKRVIRVI